LHPAVRGEQCIHLGQIASELLVGNQHGPFVSHHVVGDLVACGGDGLHQLRVGFRALPDQEERRVRAMSGEHVQQPGGGFRARPVVERESEDRGFGVDVPEDIGRDHAGNSPHRGLPPP
jgi:hypothetical protein